MSCTSIVVVVGIGACLGALAQQVPPPPKPPEGPSLEVTMKFIQENLDQGRSNYTAFVTDAAEPGLEWKNQFSVAISNVVADPKTCQISFRWTTQVNEGGSDYYDYSVVLKDVRDIVVMPQEQNQKQVDTRSGHSSWSSRIEPGIFTLIVRRPKGLENVFLFSEEQMAGRVAKAMAHALELCGGGVSPF